MTAVASVPSPWMPEDDMLLKSSIQAGASLEALAKGAVIFSRRFTLFELRDRWHSLLYDPDGSAQAFVHMVEHELSGSNDSSKLSRLDNLKESEQALEKRKFGSIHSVYFSKQKRTKNENFNSTKLGFFEKRNNDNYSAHEYNIQECIMLNHEAQHGDVGLDDCLANNLGLDEIDFEITCQAFPETIGNIAATTSVVDNAFNAFHMKGSDNSNESEKLNGSMGENSLYKLKENTISLLRNDLMGSFDLNREHDDAACMHSKVDLDNIDKSVGIEKSSTSETLPSKLLYTDEEEAKIASTCDSMNENNQILCSGFEGKQHFSSPDLDGSASFHTRGFSYPYLGCLSGGQWKMFSAPDMPVDDNNININPVSEETFALPEDCDCKRESSAGYDAAHPVSHLGDRPDGTDFIYSSVVPEGECTDLPNFLLNFSNEGEILYVDIDVKDPIADIPNSELICSFKDVPEDGLCNATVTTSLVASTSLARPSALCPEKVKSSSFHGDRLDFCHWEPSTSVSHSDALQLTEGEIICTLNAEHPEIPCNADIFLPIYPSTSFAPSVRLPIATDFIYQLSSSADEKDDEQGLCTEKEGKDAAVFFSLAQMVGPNLLPEVVSAQTNIGCELQSESPDTKCLAPLEGQPDKPRKPGQSIPLHATLLLTEDRVLEEGLSKVEFQGLDSPAIYSEMLLHSEVESVNMIDPKSKDNPSISDQNNSDGDGDDGDLSYISDIEALILEMDLASDQESCITSEVARYQYESSRRTINRLKEAARSSLQRAMSSGGTLAIFYGSHLKHHIKKTEVTIGRSTDDTDVDIDLRIEGCANKVSRQQATIKMETDGSFTLKNQGKSSISVNGKDIASGQVTALSTGCSIEIRGMSFVFEINDKYVRQYMDNLVKKSQGKFTPFEWSPAGAP